MSHLEPLRVGYVVKRYPRYSETFIVNEILAHEAAGIRVNIFSLRPPADSHFQDRIARVKAPVVYMPGENIKASEFWRSVREAGEVLPGLWTSLESAQEDGESVGDVYQAVLLACHARRKGIGHLHAHFATSAATIARLAARFAGLTWSMTAHAKDIFHESVQPEDLRRKLRGAAAVVTVSDYNLDYLRTTYGPAADRVQRIYNGLDLDTFSCSPAHDRQPLIVSVGRLIEKKGFGDLIDACAILAARGRSFQCQIVGTGEMEAELRAQIARLELQDFVELLGPLPQADVIRLVGRASVMAAPCVVGRDGNRDGMPTVLLEAMALGTPCVSTDVTGIPELLRDNETGLMVPQHDPAALATALERLLTDSPLRVRLAAAARRLIEAEYDIHCNAARMRSLFQAAVDWAPESAASEPAAARTVLTVLLQEAAR